MGKFNEYFLFVCLFVGVSVFGIDTMLVLLWAPALGREIFELIRIPISGVIVEDFMSAVGEQNVSAADKEAIERTLQEKLDYDTCIEILDNPITLVNVDGLPQLLQKYLVAYVKSTLVTGICYFAQDDELEEPIIEAFEKISLQDLLRSMHDPFYAAECCYNALPADFKTKLGVAVTKKVLLETQLEALVQPGKSMLTETGDLIADEMGKALSQFVDAGLDDEGGKNAETKPASTTCCGGGGAAKSPFAKLLRDPVPPPQTQDHL